MDSRCATWCLVLGVAACAPLPKQESTTDTAVTRQPQDEERLQPVEHERLLDQGPPATLIESVEKPESLHPKFPSDWRVLVVHPDRENWQRVPIYGAIQDWHK